MLAEVLRQQTAETLKTNSVRPWLEPFHTSGRCFAGEGPERPLPKVFGTPVDLLAQAQVCSTLAPDLLAQAQVWVCSTRACIQGMK